MNYRINKAVVIGSGTMGAAIAAHLANAGVPVTLLDIVPNKLTDQEQVKGLHLADKTVRNRIAETGLQAAIKSRPASFFSKEQTNLVTIGNLEDDFSAVANADWVLEVIIENLEIKQNLMKRIDEARKEGSIVSTNTSGIPVASIAEGRSEDFKKHFLGTHFFNPPRYLKLLEIIPTKYTLPEVTDYLSQFGEQRLGKGIVICKDTPNFIANRIGSVNGAFALDYVMEHGYTVPEVDAVTGPPMGRPKTATFRLLDLVGIDVANHVRGNLADLIPHDKTAQKYLRSDKANAVTDALIEKGWLGNKSKIGIYKTVRGEDGKKEFWPLNLQTLEHEPPGEKVRFDSVGKAKDEEDPVKRLVILLDGDDKASQLAQALIYHGFSYASSVIPEIADTPLSIDNAVRWGFMHNNGPFEIWDKLGVSDTVAAMKAAGYSPAPWVDEMLAAGHDSFYTYNGVGKTGVYNQQTKSYTPIKHGPERVSLQSLKDQGKLITKNDGASLIDMGDGIACLEFHTKVNSFDQDIGDMIVKSLDIVANDFDGMVIGNQGEHFSAGANIFMIAMHAQQGQWEELQGLIRGLQDLNKAIRYSPKPVVIAPFGATMGGGAEVMMHASRVVASAELYTGLVEVGIGVIPAGGGTKEMMRRILNPPMRTENAEPLSFAERLFMQVGTAQIATSAVEARQMGMLTEADRIIMNGDHLLAEAKREARHMANSGYVPPAPEKIYALGRDVLSALKVGLFMFEEGKYISEHDSLVGNKLAYILTGGNLSKAQWVEEQYILDLECEAFLSLCGEEKTQARMWHFLQYQKPLRN